MYNSYFFFQSTKENKSIFACSLLLPILLTTFFFDTALILSWLPIYLSRASPKDNQSFKILYATNIQNISQLKIISELSLADNVGIDLSKLGIIVFVFSKSSSNLNFIYLKRV